MKHLWANTFIASTFVLLCSPAWCSQSSSQSIASSGTIEVAFSPEQDTAGLIIKAIQQAKRQILVQAFSFTHEGIAQALISARKHGIDVNLIADREQSTYMDHGSKVEQIALAKIPVWLDGINQSAHNKVMLIDADTPEVVIITGSYNFTFAAQNKNAENLLFISGNPKLAGAYKENWLRHQAHSQSW